MKDCDGKLRHISTTTTFVCPKCGKRQEVGLPFKMIVNVECDWLCDKCGNYKIYYEIYCPKEKKVMRYIEGNCKCCRFPKCGFYRENH